MRFAGVLCIARTTLPSVSSFSVWVCGFDSTRRARMRNLRDPIRNARTSTTEKNAYSSESRLFSMVCFSQLDGRDYKIHFFFCDARECEKNVSVSRVPILCIENEKKKKSLFVFLEQCFKLGCLLYRVRPGYIILVENGLESNVWVPIMPGQGKS